MFLLQLVFYKSNNMLLIDRNKCFNFNFNYLRNPLQIFIRGLLVPILVPDEPGDEELLVGCQLGDVFLPVCLQQFVGKKPWDHFVLKKNWLRLESKGMKYSMQVLVQRKSLKNVVRVQRTRQKPSPLSKHVCLARASACFSDG